MPAPANALKAALAAGRLTRGTWLNLGSEITAEIAGRAGFDWCVVDGEHGPWDPTALRRQLIALEGTGAAGVLRVPVAEDWIIKQALDLGAQTLLVPMIDSAEEAAAVVRACRYPPHGLRGMGPAVARSGGYGAFADYAATASDELCIIVQAESRAAMADLEAICAVDGVDGVFIGPADLGADMGLGTEADADALWAEVASGLARIRAAGRAAGVLALSPDRQAQSVEAGATFLGVASDAVLLQGALARAAQP
ncbi:aldolase/citrate lyase family protein [Roseibacterium sp. SDUM158017]|uniref:HpcH/HpaI aldolase family protein n=1 Tax=Roseicyclus salinarum TaxID=3036773 RepID=UPI0024152BE7|nr:aldolase/citrate lyase family protein [Roseibacterium sp. SDUM158017]MDG4648865.1 aldolase/citrate lyase family protein [Roseibacterium sp. SDUM158017]